MANVERENVLGFVDKRRLTNTTGLQVGNATNYSSVAGLRARLATLGVSTAQLETMTKNDMVYALRLADDAAGL